MKTGIINNQILDCSENLYYRNIFDTTRGSTFSTNNRNPLEIFKEKAKKWSKKLLNLDDANQYT